MMVNKFLLLTAVMFQCVFGQIPSLLHPCPKVEVVQNFDVTKYLGKWYEQEKYPLIFEAGGKCITAEYSAKDDGTVKVFNKMIRLGSDSSIEGTAKLDSNTGEAKLLVTFNTPFPVTSPYWVLGTDYTCYSIVWSCMDIFGLSASAAWILTREQNPPADLIKTGYDILQKQNISTSLLTKTDQKSC